MGGYVHFLTVLTLTWILDTMFQNFILEYSEVAT